ncbi:hypothetical protein QJS04_geneDACA002242 [Acorus gramineus]|uniref:KRR1 small subunit processome component n=1 Tax=Acorus gramineus TaxID=55184 RepID=A0AAV9A943_ACOGR|nr:hypothetical protein QJS04_geneDACA002242 [Acorus gramineus]
MSDAMEGETERETGVKKARHKGKHDKPKPWDDDPNIDHWKIEKFDPSWNESGMLEVSSFSTLFPQYRGKKYLKTPLSFFGFYRLLYRMIEVLLYWFFVGREVPATSLACRDTGIERTWSEVRAQFASVVVEVVIHILVEGNMVVSTTRKTRDPYIIMKARDLIRLLSRSVPAPQALKILNDEIQCDIIKIGSLIRNKERFVKRRQHLIGPNSSTLKAIEILTGCYVLVQACHHGNTVAAMGSFKGLKQVRKIVEDCIQNFQHPIYHIKTLLMKRELTKNPALATENWDRFLPKFKKKNVQTKKVKSKEKKPYTPFPPPQPPSKIDLQLESGEYFLSDQMKSAKKWQQKQEKQAEKAAENKRKREAAFVPPKEKAKGLSKLQGEESIDAEAYLAKPNKAPPKKKHKKSKA